MFLQLIELACNQALEHDVSAREKLAALDGKVILLELITLNQKAFVTPHKFGVELSNELEQTPSVSLAATPAAMFKIARYGMDDANLEPGELEISGDPIVAQRFAALIANLNVDWEGLLAEHFGELPASFLSRGMTAAQSMASEGGALLKTQVNSTLINDLNLVAPSSNVDDFLEDVDDLRAKVDRLEARLQKVLKASVS